jgi:hypothetical protein
MAGVLFGIPLTRWVRGTIEKMNGVGKRDVQSWSDYWLKTYYELGGRSEASGSKGCPQHAAYGLWRLGRIKGTNLPYQRMAVNHIYQEYGNNAAYAILALELLENKQTAESKAGLWRQVQNLFRIRVHEEPATSQQGAVTVALTLFEEKQIVTGQE